MMAAELALVVILWSVPSRTLRKNESCAPQTAAGLTARRPRDMTMTSVVFVILGGCC
ncbi:hypothetical protein HMPREF9582_02248 [Cutibacterium acnes HL060PA1]|nr:hypothetical protein HMPREF9619_00089 [Cutibacterium acnes HL082PA2]EFT25850.1 hypothetical protein HMPREF9577_01592 [Cutibacterium acnes HL110PA3]EFT64495.1 hypothetical protein HMPREF9578_01593 [Cutibacterium acnes HL110PA4]EFT66738.1 hypothetical protein HMPREF9582_02248 [Cutibacterium acnes HL060PA1]EFT74901.1 hypothetical protein HMPREF9599_01305 [Cutibacterium acnes HL050PA2]EGE70370.1 hypothetical protein HMPREF9341_00073 [Cutibacterium acnes HL103PA1]GAE79615.1 hypothetical protein